MVEVKVKGVFSEKPTTRHTLILEDDSRRILSVSVGLPEAQAIVLALKKIRFSPPLMFDFIVSLLVEMSAKPVRVEIIAHRNEGYYAQFIFQVADRLKYIECRPSDGVTLALRCDIPVLVQDELLKTVSSVSAARNRKSRTVHLPPLDYAEADEIKDVIEYSSAEEFWRKIKTYERGGL
jgi:uncharacterized protein